MALDNICLRLEKVRALIVLLRLHPDIGDSDLVTRGTTVWFRLVECLETRPIESWR